MLYMAFFETQHYNAINIVILLSHTNTLCSIFLLLVFFIAYIFVFGGEKKIGPYTTKKARVVFQGFIQFSCAHTHALLDWIGMCTAKQPHTHTHTPHTAGRPPLLSECEPCPMLIVPGKWIMGVGKKTGSYGNGRRRRRKGGYSCHGNEEAGYRTV